MHNPNMGSQFLCHREDAAIERRRLDWPASAILVDLHAEEDLMRFDEEWSDEDIFKALDFANWAFDRGFQAGRTDKASEIRRVFEI